MRGNQLSSIKNSGRTFWGGRSGQPNLEVREGLSPFSQLLFATLSVCNRRKL